MAAQMVSKLLSLIILARTNTHIRTVQVAALMETKSRLESGLAEVATKSSQLEAWVQQMQSQADQGE